MLKWYVKSRAKAVRIHNIFRELIEFFIMVFTESYSSALISDTLTQKNKTKQKQAKIVLFLDIELCLSVALCEQMWF